MSKLLVWGVPTLSVDLSGSKAEILILVTEAVESKEEFRLLFPSPEAKEVTEDSGSTVYTMIQGDFNNEQQEACAHATASFLLHA